MVAGVVARLSWLCSPRRRRCTPRPERPWVRRWGPTKAPNELNFAEEFAGAVEPRASLVCAFPKLVPICCSSLSLSMLNGLESSTPLLMVVLPLPVLLPPPLSPPQANAKDTQKEGKRLMIRMISYPGQGYRR